ncbi:uncharacterized protein LOC132634707 [Lycium barbarum]|uniref:uncharacterized protein LOC132634707 n=1 Tax=Lycium barbarum TaxID=112863 RepID=UPI00293ECC2D|nr:uncharacterized protein LOC132634707 [Lycium barbarum]
MERDFIRLDCKTRKIEPDSTANSKIPFFGFQLGIRCPHWSLTKSDRALQGPFRGSALNRIFSKVIAGDCDDMYLKSSKYCQQSVLPFVKDKKARAPISGALM